MRFVLWMVHRCFELYIKDNFESHSTFIQILLSLKSSIEILFLPKIDLSYVSLYYIHALLILQNYKYELSRKNHEMKFEKKILFTNKFTVFMYLELQPFIHCFVYECISIFRRWPNFTFDFVYICHVHQHPYTLLAQR